MASEIANAGVAGEVDEVDALMNEVEKLKRTRELISELISTAESNRQRLLHGVQKWLEDVDANILETERFLEKITHENNKACLCINSSTSSRQFREKAKEKTALVVEFQEGAKHYEEAVSHPAPPPRTADFFYGTENLGDIESRKVMESLTDWKNVSALKPGDEVEQRIYPALPDVFLKLGWSSDCLESKDTQICLFLCSLFPEDASIPVEMLLVYGVGLGKFQGIDSLERVRLRVQTAISTLKSTHLLLDSEFSEGYVKMPKIVRDVALSMFVSQGQNSFLMKVAGVDSKGWPKDSHNNYMGVSLMGNSVRKLPVGKEYVYPDLRALLLLGNRGLSRIPEDFFPQMEGLQVLDLQRTGISSLPQSLANLTNLHALLLGFSKLKDISVVGELLELEILIIQGCDLIKEIPAQICKLVNLKLFDIRRCERLNQVPEGLLASLHKLEEFYVGLNFLDWEIDEKGNPKNNVCLMELSKLSQLLVLDIFMPILINSVLENILFDKLHRFKIQIGGYMSHSVDAEKYQSYSTIFIVAREMKIPLLGWMKKLIKATHCLVLVYFRNLNRLLYDLDEALIKLRCLELKSCHDISYLVEKAEVGPQLYTWLEELQISNLGNFRGICCDQLAGESFSRLRRIYVGGCHEMLNIISSKSQQVMHCLEALEVKDCKSLSSVFEVEEGHVMQEGATKFLSKLKFLDLQNLPELEAIWNIDDQFICLTDLVIFKVKKCPELRRTVSTTLAQGLHHLEKLFIDSNCSLEEVFGTDEDRIIGCEREAAEAVGEIELPCLRHIILYDLRNLKCFCSGNQKIKYPSLEKVEIVDCPKMETWGRGVQETPLLKNVIITKESYSYRRTIRVIDLERFRGLNDIIVQKNFKISHEEDVDDDTGEVA